jgi:hypothetical protein
MGDFRKLAKAGRELGKELSKPPKPRTQTSEQSAKERGCGVVCREMLADRSRITELQCINDSNQTYFLETLDVLAKAAGIQTGRAAWWDAQTSAKRGKLISRIKVLRETAKRD